jgi:mRNA interferase RelE/StbE
MPKQKSVELSNQVDKQVRAIPSTYHEAIKATIAKLADDAHLGTPLKKPLDGYWKYRVGPYRIIYHFSDTVLTIDSIMHRKEVYR